MQATKTHISLETAKLLKDCGVESRGVFVETLVNEWNYVPIKADIIVNREGYKLTTLPAYTWQEILWENAEEFFGKKYIYCGGYSWAAFEEYPKDILTISSHLLQQRKYKEADLYFREHCILIK